jgi:hypothetical protein
MIHGGGGKAPSAKIFKRCTGNKVNTMLIDKEVIGTMEISLHSVDNLFVRTEFGTHYVIARDIETNKMRSQQVFQDFGEAQKYYKYFKEGYAKPKTYGIRSEHIQNVIKAGELPGKGYASKQEMRKYISKAPWWYNLGRI